MRCPNCGVALTGASSFCLSCGATVSNASATSSVGALGDRDYQHAPLPAGPYEIMLGPSEVLSAAFRMWSRDWGRLVLLALFPILAAIPLIGVGVGYFLLGVDSPGDEPSIGMMIGLGGIGVVGIVLLFIAYLASMAGTIALVDERERGGGAGTLTVGQAFLHGLSKAGRLFCVTFVSFAVLGVTFGAIGGPIAALVALEEPFIAFALLPGIAISILGVYLCMRLAPITAIAVVEDIPLGDVFGRAFELTRGQAGTVFVCALIYGVVVFGINMASGILGLIPILGALVQIAANLVTASLGPTWQLALYAGLVRNQQQQSGSR